MGFRLPSWDSVKQVASGPVGALANPINYAFTAAGAGANEGLRAMAPSIHKKLFGEKARGPTDNFDKNAALQREFAQNSIRWKVNDAKMAGIHPLYAIGAQGTSFSPMYSSSAGESQSDIDTAALGEAGQNVVRAIGATRTQEEKMAAALNLEGMRLDNELKASQIRQINSPAPSFPGDQNFIEGQGNSGPKIKNKTMERVTSMAGRPDLEPGSKTGVGFYNTADGGLVPVPSVDTKQSIEDNMIQELLWSLRNNVVPNITGGDPPPGYHWSKQSQAYKKRKDPHWMDDYHQWWKGGR